ncbi:MAG: TetR/AcrR family transcriptional regulator [Acidimicrobiia bacterium]
MSLTAVDRSLAPGRGYRADEALEARVVTATLACIARFGLAKLTVDDVAREAGCGRATVYRRVGGKSEVEGATVTAEVQRLARRAWAEAARADTLDEVIVAVLVTVAREVEGHAALQFLFAFEPEQVLVHLAFEQGDRFLAQARFLLAPVFDRFLEPDAAERLAEYLIRILVSYVCSPDAEVSMTDGSAVRSLVRAFVVPAFAGLGTKPARGELP